MIKRKNKQKSPSLSKNKQMIKHVPKRRSLKGFFTANVSRGPPHGARTMKLGLYTRAREDPGRVVFTRVFTNRALTTVLLCPRQSELLALRESYTNGYTRATSTSIILSRCTLAGKKLQFHCYRALIVAGVVDVFIMLDALSVCIV